MKERRGGELEEGAETRVGRSGEKVEKGAEEAEKHGEEARKRGGGKKSE